MKSKIDKPFSTYQIEHSDAYTSAERQQIADNIIEFVECSFKERAKIVFGHMVVEVKLLTLTDMKTLMNVHDDVLGRIEHN